MTRKEWFWVLLPLVICWFVDHLTKRWASDLDSIINYGILHFALHHNPGAMLGLFSDLPPVLRIVSLSTGGAFLLCTYAIIQYLLPIKSMRLRIGLSLLIGGIIGNVTDRILWGHVVDFIVFVFPNWISPAFNIADAVQWVGYILISYSIIKEGDLLWPENNLRKKYWINIQFQLKYCFFLMGVGLGIGLISVVFSYTYMRVTLEALVGANEMILHKYLLPYVLVFSMITVGFTSVLFALGKFISHKVAGPVYSFEKFLNDLLSGVSRPFKLRTKDEFKHLEPLAESIREEFDKRGLLKATGSDSPKPNP